MTPKILYHGSLYKQDELMPGFKRSGKITMWDGIESNQYLYTTTDKQEAESLGIGSAVEKVFETERFNTEGKIITIWSRKPIPLEEFLKLEIYVYTIPYKGTDGWVHNNNQQNNIDTEWITKNTVYGVSVEQLCIKTWLADKCLVITQAPTDIEPSKLVSQFRNQVQIHNNTGIAFP